MTKSKAEPIIYYFSVVGEQRVQIGFYSEDTKKTLYTFPFEDKSIGAKVSIKGAEINGRKYKKYDAIVLNIKKINSAATEIDTSPFDVEF